MYKNKFILISYFFISGLALKAQQDIKSVVFSNGASAMKSSNIHLNGTLGQTIINNTNSSAFLNAQGFWRGYQSKVISNTADESKPDLNATIYPNPIISEGYINLNLAVPSNLKISIVNLLGIELHNYGTKKYTAGNHIIPLDCDELSGVLYALINSQTSTLVLPFMKIK